MDLMLKYRNERKAEGATAAELKIYDGKIHSLMSTGCQKKNDLDMELLIYRRQRLSEGALMTDIALIDKQIHRQFGATPSRIGDVLIRRLDSKDDLRVSVDFNNSSIGDLYTRVAGALGVSSGRMRLIFKGKHLDNSDRSLTEIHLEPGDAIGFCMKLGCDGRCCDQYYNMMCDGLLRSADTMFKDYTPEHIQKVLVAYSNFKAISAISEKKEPRPEGLCVLVEEAPKKHSIWTSLLAAAADKEAASALVCEALSNSSCEPLLREKTMKEKPAVMHHVSPAESRSESPQSPNNVVVASDEDLYDSPQSPNNIVVASDEDLYDSPQSPNNIVVPNDEDLYG